MDVYAENILEHYRDPRGKRVLQNPTFSQREVNRSCGDELEIRLIVEGGIIREIAWQGTGCAVSQAAMSMLCEELEGKTIDVLANLEPKDVYDLLGVPIGPRRVNCALLALHGLRKALPHLGKTKA